MDRDLVSALQQFKTQEFRCVPSFGLRLEQQPPHHPFPLEFKVGLPCKEGWESPRLPSTARNAVSRVSSSPGHRPWVSLPRDQAVASFRQPGASACPGQEWGRCLQ